MIKLLALLAVTITAATSMASWSEGLAILENVAEIPQSRYDSLSCWRDNSNRDLCRIEEYRINTAENNIYHYSGDLYSVRNDINADIQERQQRMSSLSCWRNNSNRDLCAYEEMAISELEYTHLSRINRAINNSRGRDRTDRDRPRDRRKDRTRGRERERREKERDRGRRRRGRR